MNSALIDTFLKITLRSAAALAGTLAPRFVDRKKVTVFKNISYGNLPDQILDVYVPKNETPALKPISILIHGGGFRYFSKDSHATAANELAQNGRIVFSINYRLSPKNPYPSGLIDTILAYSWIIKNANQYGGDLQQISLLGESAGGNYALALCLYLFGLNALDSKFELPEIPTEKPKHAVIHCGHLHVSNVDRYIQTPNIHPVVLSRIKMIQRDYLPNHEKIAANEAGLADPLIEIEKLAQKGLPLPTHFPQLFVPVGDRDPVGGDSIRLAQALETLGQKNRLRTYIGEGHAFYLMPFRKNTRTCWNDIFHFLNT